MRAEQASQSPWIKSRHCGASSTCVEVRRLPDGMVGVRGEHVSGATILVLDETSWRAFTDRIKSGAHDLTA
ncbi:DUF397 domain-containing protein [Spirillospora sp. NPDC047279]|uniref:DUF397 domain-containing protein n=1 Tax=Spirillospora sp. NPDC047279 TaxID=3155478 RepID=UPI0033D3DFD2